MAPAIRLALAYRAMVDRWLAVVLREFRIDAKEKDPAVPSDGGFTWIKERVSLLRAEIDESIPEGEIDLSLERVQSHVETVAKRIGLPTVALRPILGSGAIEAYRRKNLTLIRSLADDQIGEFEEILTKAEMNNWRVEEIRKVLIERFEVTKSKADLLARDQVLKLNGQITKDRQAQAGITHYIWSTAGDERVRGNPNGKWPEGSHYDLEGETFSWADPPVIDERSGRRGHPGDDYQCRCVAIPVLSALPSGDAPED